MEAFGQLNGNRMRVNDYSMLLKVAIIVSFLFLSIENGYSYTYSDKDIIVLNTNKTLAEQMTKENSIYEFRDNFDLKGKTLIIPDDCILNFEKGILTNGSIKGNHTQIKGYDQPIFSNISIAGTYKNEMSKTAWFKETEGCINKCQIISKNVQISESKNYGTVDLQDGCVLDINGKDAIFNLIRTFGNSVHININGGSIGSTLGGGIVAETVTGGKTFKAQDGNSFYVGQKLHSSKIQDFFGTANFPLKEPVLVTAVNGNTISINKDLGTRTLHEGLGLGNFKWEGFIKTYGKELTVSNGIIKNIYSYICSTESDGIAQFHNVQFLNLGLDCFALKHYGTLKFDHCYFSKPLDYGKTTIMLYQGNIEVNNCKSEGGNYDYFIGCWQGDYKGDDTVDKGYIRITDSEFDGTKFDTDPSIQSCLHLIGLEKHGVLDEVSISNCTFKGFVRHIFSSSTIPGDWNIRFKKVHFDKCHFHKCAFMNFLVSSISFDDIEVSNCTFTENGNFMLHMLNPSGTSVKYRNCKFDNIKSHYQQFTTGPTQFIGCEFNNCTIYRKAYANMFSKCLFVNSPVYFGNNEKRVQTLGDNYTDCTFKNVKTQFTTYSNCIGKVNIENSIFEKCSTVVQTNKGTDFRNVSLLNCSVNDANRVLDCSGYVVQLKIDGMKTKNIGNNMKNAFYVAGGANNVLKNIEGMKDFSGGPYSSVRK